MTPVNSICDLIRTYFFPHPILLSPAAGPQAGTRCSRAASTLGGTLSRGTFGRTASSAPPSAPPRGAPPVSAEAPPCLRLTEHRGAVLGHQRPRDAVCLEPVSGEFQGFKSHQLRWKCNGLSPFKPLNDVCARLCLLWLCKVLD